MDHQVGEDIPLDEVHLEEEDPQGHQEEDHLVPLEIPDPLETQDPQVHPDHEDIEDLLAH